MSPCPITAGQRWGVERTHAWFNGFKKLVWCTERRAVVVAFWLAFATVIVRRLIREGWTRYRWDIRPALKPRAPSLLAQALMGTAGHPNLQQRPMGLHKHAIQATNVSTHA